MLSRNMSALLPSLLLLSSCLQAPVLPELDPPELTTPGAKQLLGQEGLPSQVIFPDKPKVFTLSELRQRVFSINTPDLQAGAQRCREALGQIQQSNLLPNPTLMLRKESLGHQSNGIDSGLTKIEYGQRLELGGKREARTITAQAKARVTYFQFREQQLSTLLKFQKQFYRILRLAEEHKLAQEEARLANEMANLGQLENKAMRIARIELNKIEIAAHRAELKVQDLGYRQRSACLELDGLLGAPPGTTAGVKGSWSQEQSQQKWQEHRHQLTNHPRRRAKEESITANRNNLHLAQAKAWPDLTLFALGMRDGFNEEDYFGLGFGLPLPLFDRNQGNITSANSALIGSRRELIAECARLKAELLTASTDLDRASRLLTKYKNDIIPRVEETFNLTKLRYKAGRSSHLEVIDSLLLLAQTRREALTHQEAKANALCRIWYLLGSKEPGAR